MPLSLNLICYLGLLSEAVKSKSILITLTGEKLSLYLPSCLFLHCSCALICVLLGQFLLWSLHGFLSLFKIRFILVFLVALSIFWFHGLLLTLFLELLFWFALCTQDSKESTCFGITRLLIKRISVSLS